MREQGVTQHNLKLKVHLGEPLHVGPKVLMAGTGVLDSDHMNIDAIRINSVDVHNHAEPVGVSLHAGNGEDAKMLATTHRECYVSHDMDAMGESAMMHHAIAHTGSAFHPHTLNLVQDGQRESLHAQADARLMRWATKTSDDIGPHMNYKGVHSITNEATGEIKHLVPIDGTSTDALPRFFAQNQNATFLEGAYKPANQKMADYQGKPHMIVEDTHMKAAAAVLSEHLTPQSPLSKGLTITATPLDNHPAQCGSHAVVSLSLLRTPVSDAPASAQGEAAMTYSAGGDSTASELHAQVFGIDGK